MSIPLRVLFAEDSEDDALLLVRELKRGGYDLTYERVASADAMTAALDRHVWDLVIGDHSMPQFSGRAALTLLRGRGLDVPFISVSGTISEEEAVAAMKAGASDYFAKGQLNRLLPAIERELREAKGRQARRTAEAAAQQSEASHAALVERAPVGIYRSTPEGRFLSANAALVRMLGYPSADEVLHLDLIRDVFAESAEQQALLDLYRQPDHEYDEVDATWKRKDGRLLHVQLSVRAVRNGEGLVECYETFARDVTDQRRLQAQLAQAQKMEAIGRLAGGIAHDFNNLLTVITGYTDLLLEDLDGDDPHRDEVEEVRKAAEGAVSLTRQLLAFSRQQVIEPRVLDLNRVIGNVRRMLQRVIGEDIAFAASLAPDLCPVRADVGQLEQVLMNLAVNARDAMPTGGKLTLETANGEVQNESIGTPGGAAPSQCAVLTVSDTGVGMDDATKARIFEPFFTTKGLGKGTGLGLATVYGIVEQAGGSVTVDSELGRGTRFKIYLPAVNAPPEEQALSSGTDGGRGTETVLLVEDAAGVRAVARQALDRQGYTVLEASNGEAALELAATHPGPIHLLLTDVVMPELSGRQVAERLVRVRPKTAVLYMSGYTDDAIVRHGILEAGIAYIQKPFPPDGLARKVREVLDVARNRMATVGVVPKGETATRARILVIDDDEAIRTAIRRTLEHAGHDVLEAADGVMGLRVYRESGADVIVVDLFMPGRDGLEFIRDLRTEGRSTKIIAISGGGRSQQTDLLKAAAVFGAARTLSKPLALADLVAAVHDLLGVTAVS
jgi:PAS domain S-box-containing protein